jgi:hypothetical protein
MIALSLLVSAALTIAADPPAANPLFEELTHKGIRLLGGADVLLPEPSMADGLDAAAQRRVIEDYGRRSGVAEFLRKSERAQYALTLKPLQKEPGQRPGERIDLHFVGFGSLEQAGDQNLFERLIGAGGHGNASRSTKTRQSAAEGLPATWLEARHLQPRHDANLQERYLHVHFELLERYLVTGVGYAVESRAPESIIFAMHLDPRFVKDADYPNQWQEIKQNGSLGPPNPYAGYGGYTKATVLQNPKGALFVESHSIFYEPSQWFKGNPKLLSSKLPIVIQDNVYRFRRELARAGKPAPPRSGP